MKLISKLLVSYFKYISYIIHTRIIANVLLFSLAILISSIFNQLIALGLILLLLIFNWKVLKTTKLFLVFLIILAFTISLSSINFQNSLYTLEKFKEDGFIKALVIYQPTLNEYSQEAVLSIEGLNLYAKVNLNKYLEIYQYDEIVFKGIINILENNTFDISKRIGFEFKNIEVINISRSNNFYRIIQEIRFLLDKAINSSFSEPTNSLTKGILLGSKSNISQENNNLLKETGIFHIISVSGSNFSIIFSSIFLLNYFINRKLLSILGILILIFYLLIVGIDVLPALRAICMILFKEFNLYFGHMSDNLTSLLFSILVILLIFPFYYLNISFQLSIFATLGIILLTSKFEDFKIFIFKLGENFKQSFSAITFTSIITFINFKEINLNGLFSNIVLLPLIPILMLSSILTIVFTNLGASAPFEFISKLITEIFFLINNLFRNIFNLEFNNELILILIFLFILILDIYNFKKHGKKIHTNSFINHS